MRGAAVVWLLLSLPARADTGAVDIDGDTLVADGIHWRLAGINAPETAHPEYGKPRGEPGGPEAAAFMAAVMRGHDVHCVQRGREASYERLVGYCAADGRDLGEMAVRAGWACRWVRFDGAGRYEAAEAACGLSVAESGLARIGAPGAEGRRPWPASATGFPPAARSWAMEG